MDHHHDASRSAAPGPGAPSRTDSPHYLRATETQIAARRTSGARRMGFGAVWLAVGLLITIVTLAHFATSGFAIIAFGPIIGGALQMISGHRMRRAATEDASGRET